MLLPQRHNTLDTKQAQHDEKIILYIMPLFSVTFSITYKGSDNRHSLTLQIYSYLYKNLS